MSTISWRTYRDNPHTNDPRYGFVGPNVRFVLVYLGGDSWFATDRFEDGTCGGLPYQECVDWCWKRLPAHEQNDVAGLYEKGSGV